MSSTLLPLVNKVALITGGSGTIGKAIATALLSHGAHVIMTSRTTVKLEQAKKEILDGVKNNSIDSSQLVLFPCDISNEDSVVHLFQNIDELLNQQQPQRNDDNHQEYRPCIDILINNAGCNIAGAATDLSAHDMESVLGVNVIGAFLCSREVMKRMIQRNKMSKNDVVGGRIINIGSISATSPRPNSVAYTTSKFALQGLTQSLALDGRAHHIAVGIIHPGNVISELLSKEEIRTRSLTEGFIQPEDVAQCVVTMSTLPYSTNVLELTVIPTSQPFIGRG